MMRNTCHVFQAEGKKVTRQEIIDLFCDHEEADTRMVFHLNYISKHYPNENVVVRVLDTDVLVIILGNLHKINLNVWIQTGLISNNSLKYIHCNNLWKMLGTTFCRALIAFHRL